MSKDMLGNAHERIRALIDGKTLQHQPYGGGGAWMDIKVEQVFDVTVQWLSGSNCRIKPTPKTIPLSLETWPPGLVQLKAKGSGNLWSVSKVTSSGVRFADDHETAPTMDFKTVALNYTHHDGRPLTIEVDG